MAVTENDIIQNSAAIAALINTGAANVNITDLAAVTSLSASDLLHCSVSNVDKKITKGNLLTNADSYTNLLINGNMDVWQRGISFTAATNPINSDDTYLVDRGILLSDGNDIVDVSQSTDKPDGSVFSLKSIVQTTPNKQFGFCKILESKYTKGLDNGTVSLSFQAKTTTGKVINNIRAVVLSWRSTADSVISDVVGTWAGGGTDPTWAANWTPENTPSNLALTTSWQRFKIENISIDTATVNNLAVFIWVDDTDLATNDELFLTQIQLNKGPVAVDFIPTMYETEYIRCLRYLEQLNFDQIDIFFIFGFADSSTVGTFSLKYHEKRTNPTISVNSVIQYEIRYTGASTPSTNITSGRQDPFAADITLTVAAVLTPGQGVGIRSNNANNWFRVDAEL